MGTVTFNITQKTVSSAVVMLKSRNVWTFNNQLSLFRAVMGNGIDILVSSTPPVESGRGYVQEVSIYDLKMTLTYRSKLNIVLESFDSGRDFWVFEVSQKEGRNSTRLGVLKVYSNGLVYFNNTQISIVWSERLATKAMMMYG